MPIWATLMALPILGERLNTVRALALTLCVAGMSVLIYPLATLGIPTGILLAVGAAIGWAAGTIYLKWAKIDGDPMAAALWQLVIGVIVIGALLPIVEGSLHLAQAHWGAILAMIFSGVIGSGISYFLWFDIVRRLPATVAALGILSSPVIGVVSSMLLLGEQPTLTDIVGFALMLGASAACCCGRRASLASPRLASLQPDRAHRYSFAGPLTAGRNCANLSPFALLLGGLRHDRPSPYDYASHCAWRHCRDPCAWNAGRSTE
jgi:uncharacterized membrane protein